MITVLSVLVLAVVSYFAGKAMRIVGVKFEALKQEVEASESTPRFKTALADSDAMTFLSIAVFFFLAALHVSVILAIGEVNTEHLGPADYMLVLLDSVALYAYVVALNIQQFNLMIVSILG